MCRSRSDLDDTKRCACCCASLCVDGFAQTRLKQSTQMLGEVPNPQKCQVQLPRAVSRAYLLQSQFCQQAACRMPVLLREAREPRNHLLRYYIHTTPPVAPYLPCLPTGRTQRFIIVTLTEPLQELAELFCLPALASDADSKYAYVVYDATAGHNSLVLLAPGSRDLSSSPAAEVGALGLIGTGTRPALNSCEEAQELSEVQHVARNIHGKAAGVEPSVLSFLMRLRVWGT